MKKLYTALTCAVFATNLCVAQYASPTFTPVKKTDRTVYFSTDAEGEYLPILWGLDTAWPDEWNMRRGVRFIGAENIGVARVSFQPWDFMPTTTLTDRLERNLQDRLRLVSYIGGPGKVQIVLNNDGPLEECDSRYFHAADDPEACRAYCNLIYGTMLSCQDKGWEVITASPLNEPDYEWNGQGSKADFLAIAKMLKQEYPQFKEGKVRISGGNTLNCDQAEPWYTYLYDYIDEGNTHQLAGDFDHYADFFTKVRADGKYATADELHNVMEAMVGVEYGMQTGIWWGTAELARGEFCRASFGRRLAYAENRGAWSSASVYRAPDGRLQAFVGQSERQADKCSYRFVSQDRDVFFNGQGPLREYVVDLPGGKGYQLPEQTSAECVIDITWGEDVSPVIDGDYMIMNIGTKRVIGIDGDAVNLAVAKQYAQDAVSHRNWSIRPVPVTVGGDFSYYFIKLADNDAYKLDVINWSLEENGAIIIYDGGSGNNEQWYLKYAGDGCFRIFSRHSGLCLQIAADGDEIVQASPADSPAQLWRLIPTDAVCETEVPEAPANLVASANSASVTLTWAPSASADVDQYYVVRAESGTTEFTTVGRGITGVTYTDNTVEHGKTYIYKVKAIDRAYNSSAFCAEAWAAVDARHELVARWLFNKSLVDESPNHFDAAVYDGAKVTYTTGRDGSSKALNIAMNRYVQLPYRVFDRDELTVGMWIRPKALGGHQTILSYGSDDDHYMALDITNTGEIQLIKYVGANVATIGGGKVPENDWSHIAVTVDKGQATLYVNGESVAAGSGFEAPGAPVLNYVGCGPDLKDSFLTAYIEDLCVYQGAISASDISKMMDGVVGTIDALGDGQIVGEEYYNMLGARVANPSNGVYVVKRVYDNGRVTTAKVRF